MIKLTLFLTLLLLCGCSTLGWAGRDQAAFSVGLACRAADVMQTSWGMRNGYEESNPLYGSDPSDARLIAINGIAAGVIWWAAKEDPQYRTLILAVTTIPCLVSVASNYSNGARP